MDNKNKQSPLEPVFKHRFDITQASDINHVTDSIGLITEKARGVLYLLFGQFESGSERYNDQILQGAIDAVISEIDDIDSIIKAYHEARKTPA